MYVHAHAVCSHDYIQQLLEVPTKLYEAACDCICSTLYTCEDAPDYYPMAVVLQAQVKNLLPVYKAAVQAEDSNRYEHAWYIYVVYVRALSLFPLTLVSSVYLYLLQGSLSMPDIHRDGRVFFKSFNKLSKH